MKKKKKKLGIALGGGAARGIAHIGFLRALEEKMIVPNIICGTSMGAMVGACYADEMSLDEIEKRALSLRLFDIVDIDPVFYVSGGMLRGRKVENLMSSLLSCENIEELKIPFGCMAVNVETGELEEITHGNLVEALRATSAIPGAFKPAKMGDKMYIDGGVLERIPCSLTRKMGADVVIGVNVIAPPIKTFKVRNMFDLLTRTFEITDHAITSVTKFDCDLMLDISDENIDPLQVKNIDKAIVNGYNITMENMDKILSLIE